MELNPEFLISSCVCSGDVGSNEEVQWLRGSVETSSEGVGNDESGNAIEEGAYGSSQAPFGKVPIDAKVSPGSAPLPIAPAAPAANVVS